MRRHPTFLKRVVEVCGPNEAIGFMSVIDGSPRSSTARVKEAAELTSIDEKSSNLWWTKYLTLRCT